MEEHGPQYLVDGVRLSPSDTAWQQALERAHAGGVKPLCLCRPDGVPMYVARYEHFVVKRLPDTGHQHHPTCPSYESPASQSGLGEVLGEAVIERAPDRVEVRLDFPLTRRIGRPVTPGDPCGVCKEVVAQRRRLGLRGLAHLLLQVPTQGPQSTHRAPAPRRWPTCGWPASGPVPASRRCPWPWRSVPCSRSRRGPLPQGRHLGR
jgi:hypothetical protein